MEKFIQTGSESLSSVGLMGREGERENLQAQHIP